MFYSCSHPTPPKATHPERHPPQAPNEEAERRQRHLSVCQEVMDLSMKLTRVAARRALDAADDEAQARAANPDPTPEPLQPTPKTRDLNLAFTRVSRIALQAVTLEARIAAGAFNRAGASRAPADVSTQEEDARIHSLCAALDRDLVVHGLERLTETHPDRQALRQSAEDALDDSLADHPEEPLSAHFARVCQALNLTPTVEGFPDYLVEALHPEPPPPGAQATGPIPDD